MSDHLISRSRFLDALVLDADNKTDLIQVHQALEKAVQDPDEVRGVGKWIWHDNLGWDDSLECSCCAEEFVVYDGEFPGIDSFKFCPNCGAKMLPEPPKGVE